MLVLEKRFEWWKDGSIYAGARATCFCIILNQLSTSAALELKIFIRIVFGFAVGGGREEVT